MGNLLKIIKQERKERICAGLKYFSTSKSVLKELGEPIIVEDDHICLFAVVVNNIVGFLSYNNSKILYVYVLPEYRKRGIFTKLYNELPKQNWIVMSSNLAKPIYEKRGFRVVKSYKTCHKMKLKNNE